MTDAEATLALRMLVGEWPAPPLDETGAATWRVHLREWAAGEFAECLADLVRKTGRDFRPTPSVFYAQMGAVRRRKIVLPKPELPPERRLSVDEARVQFAAIRRVLRKEATS